MCNLSVVLDRVGDRCVSSLGPQPSYTVSKLTWLTLFLGNSLPLRHRYIRHQYKARGVLFIYFLRLTRTIVVKDWFSAVREKMAEKEVQKKLRSNRMALEDEILEFTAEEKKKDEESVLLASTKNAKADKTTGKVDSRKKVTTASSTKKSVSADVHTSTKSATKESNDNIMTMLNSILENQKKQDVKINALSSKVTEIEESYDYEYQNEEGEIDENDNQLDGLSQNDDDDDNIQSGEKRKRDDSDMTLDKVVKSRFSSMSKRFKSKEICSAKVDETLAANITDLFRNGMNEDQYSEMVKDENNSRPENCEGLQVVKTNQLVWDIISPEAKTNDRKMQNVETSLIKGSVILTKVADKLASLENELDVPQKEKLGKIIDECNDSLALFGQANRQINLTRRDLIKPELRYEYLHLCAQSVPFTSLLFGDDISKTAKEIEDCSKIGNKLLYNNRGSSYRGRSRGRFVRGARRARGAGRGNYGQYGYSYQNRQAASGSYAKNSRRGSGPQRKTQ